MLHTLWTMLPTIVYLIVVGGVVFVAGWWAAVKFDTTDEWLFGPEAKEHVMGDTDE